MTRDFTALIAALLSNVLWGSTFLASKKVLALCPPLAATLVRFLIASLLLTFFCLWRRNDFQVPLLRRRWRGVLALGFLGYTGAYLLQMVALRSITSSQSAAIMLLAPVFTLAIAAFVSQGTRVADVVALVCSLLGTALILFDQVHVDFFGIASQGLALTVLSAFCLGASVPLTKRLLKGGEGGDGFTVVNITLYSLLLGLVGLLPFVVAELRSTQQTLQLTTAFWLWSLYLGLCCSVIAFLLWNWSIQIVSPVVAAIAMYLKTPVALALGALALREALSSSFYLGTALILFSIFGNQLWKIRTAR